MSHSSLEGIVRKYWAPIRLPGARLWPPSRESVESGGDWGDGPVAQDIAARAAHGRRDARGHICATRPLRGLYTASVG